MNGCTLPHVLVTGASSGIGRETALRLAAGGWHVYAGVRKTADGAALATAAAGELTPLLLDVTDTAQIAAAAQAIAGHAGDSGLAGLVNNAGIGIFGPLELIPVEQFRRQLDVNVTGQLAVTQAMLPLLRRTRGRIVMIGSIGTRFTPPFIGPLAASKSALATVSTALRQELAPFGIRVVLVEPGSIRSEAVGKLDSDARQVLGRASPEDQANY
ncbi:MAG TPA: SDR family NAD(P)-dependent oxidoreductase [Streptosporangiaceae bacterium]|jgi:NAD(P)-dependent dehydrogenase (short-subunit alcohol dehydrogenase family)